MLTFAADPIIKLVKSSTARKEAADRRLRYYFDEQSDDTRRLIERRFNSPETFRIFSLNLVRKIINKRATTYRLPPKRIFHGFDQAKGDALYSALNADGVLKKASRFTKLLKTTALQVGWRDGQPTLNALSPNILDVVADDPERPSRLIVTHKGATEADTEYSDWTATGYVRRDYRGHPIKREGNRENVNPYGVLPFIPLFDTLPDDRFFLPGGNDLIEVQEAINVALANLWRAVELQAHGQAWATGINAGEALQTGPDRAITLPQGGTFGFAAPNAPIEAILQAIEFVLRQVAAVNDVGADVFDLSKRAESGSAKHAERIDLKEARQDDIALWRAYEHRLFEMIKRVVNVHAPGTIPESATVAVDFAELQDNLTEAEFLENTARKLELGLWSQVDAILAQNPDGFATRKDAYSALAERKEEADALISQVI